MSVLVDFTIPKDRFKFGDFIASHEELTAELEPIVPTGDGLIPYVWVTGLPDQLDALTETLESSEKIASVSVLDDLSISDSEKRAYLYRIEWILEGLDIINGIVTFGGAILEGASTPQQWNLRFRFENHQNVSEFYQYLADKGISDFQINRIYELEERRDNGEDPLSAEQREALAIAAEHGYFDLPGEGTLSDVGETLEISQQAASERVRRGLRNLVFDELNIPSET